MKQNKKILHPERITSYFLSEIFILAVITVSGIIYNVGMAAGPWYEGQLVQRLYDIINGTKNFSSMLTLAAAYLVVIALVQGSRAIKRYGVRVFANDVSRSMRHVLYHSLVNMDTNELKKEGTGSLMTKAIADVDACSEGMRKFTTEVFDTGVVMVVYIVMLLSLDLRLTILTLLFTPFAYVIADRLKKAVSSANSAYKKSASALNQMTLDRISNAVTYRVFGREQSRNDKYEEQLDDYASKSIKANIFEGSLAPIYDGIAMIGAVLILYFGSRNVTGSGWTEWSIASFTTYLACFTKLATKTSHAAKLFNAVQKAQVSWKRIKPLMEKADMTENDEKHISAQPSELIFENVSCGYERTDILSGISFSAKPGEIIGVTGMVASGKSLLGKTLIDLVPWSGHITIGDRDFASMTKDEKREFVTYMGHEPELLSTSVEENVTLGDDIDAGKWLKIVMLDGEVSQMAGGIKSSIGMGGTQLSGGQQARLALARTLAHAAPVVVLDDPLSAVDRITEEKILENIRKELPDSVVLLISHRLYHFPELDRVLFVHDTTADFGTHDEIMNRELEYSELYNRQINGGDLDEEQ